MVNYDLKNCSRLLQILYQQECNTCKWSWTSGEKYMFQKEVFNNERVRFSRKMVKELICFISFPTNRHSLDKIWAQYDQRICSAQVIFNEQTEEILINHNKVPAELGLNYINFHFLNAFSIMCIYMYIQVCYTIIIAHFIQFYKCICWILKQFTKQIKQYFV